MELLWGNIRMKKVLFVCVENSCRSQMAEGFFNNLSKEDHADSAGTKPAKNVNLTAIQVMKEANIDISQERPKLITPQMNKEFDYILTMGCIDGCPLTPKHKTIEWNIPDPNGKSIDFFRKTRDNIRKQVKKIIEEIDKNEN
jgi:arsenate reductase